MSEETKAKIRAAMKGWKLSAPHKEKIRQTSLGRKHSQQTKERLRSFFKGRKITWSEKLSTALKGKTYAQLHGPEKALERRHAHSATMRRKWEGKPRAYRFRNDPRYRDWRTAVFQRDDFTCSICGSRGGLKFRLEAHHVKRWSTHVDLRYEVSNGVTVCKGACHKEAAKTRTTGVKSVQGAE